jgi:UDP-glucose 4-epimerase
LKEFGLHYLVTGGAGYIGSHVVLQLQRTGHTVTILDDFSSGHRWAVDEHECLEVDLREADRLKAVLRGRRFDGVFHFAAKSLVGESARRPLFYYQNNIAGTANLLEVALENGWHHCVFSSTAAVYGQPQTPLMTEDHPLAPINVYGQTKRVMEQMLASVCGSGDLSAVCLRYFNAAGAAPEQNRGEWHEPETHLIPNILRRAAGEDRPLKIFGVDYDTPDGTCIRDYIHVLDLADAHIKAMEYLQAGKGFLALNLGSSTGFSVREVLGTCEARVGHDIPHEVGERRAGDPERLVADASLAKEILGWSPQRDLQAIVDSAWQWECYRRERLLAG